jgi:predicted transcriptional regulator
MSNQDGQVVTRKASNELELVTRQLGLSENESKVYTLLLKQGALSASTIAKLVGISRPNCYNVLAALEQKKLCAAQINRSKKLFSPAHPESLRRNLEQEELAIKSKVALLELNFESLISHYRLTQGESGVYHFTGVAGLKFVYEDLIRDRLPVFSIQDRFKLRQSLGDFNTEWLKARRKFKIWNKIISPIDPDFVVDETDNSFNFRQVKYIPRELFPFEIDVKTNGKKVVITRFAGNQTGGIVIADPLFASNFTLIFNLLWNLA